jgi:hypothetical protein
MEMVEVFKTNVETDEQATQLAHQICEAFTGYAVNFDLDDCDRVLRVHSTTGSVQSEMLINLLNDCGFDAAVLPDEIPPFIGDQIVMSAL